MPDTKKAISKKQQDSNLKERNSNKAIALEKRWLKGYKTGMEQDIMEASKK